MDTEGFIIQVISDHLNNKSTLPPNYEIDWGAVVWCFKIHELAGILYHQCRDFIPADCRTELQRQNAAVMYYHANRLWEEESLKKALTESGITFFGIKGAAVAEFYPQPAYRTMGDTDLVVHAGDMEGVDVILMSMGYENEKKSDDCGWKYSKNDMAVEVHESLVLEGLSHDRECTCFFGNPWDYVRGNELNWSYHFLFLIYHLRKHFVDRGVGLRQFVDIAVLTKGNTGLDWPWIQDRLRELNMWEFARRVFALNRYWFGTEVPLEVGEFDRGFLASATGKILRNGVFGFHDAGNRDNSTANRIRNKKKKKYGVGKILLGFFPEYGQMVIHEEYAFLRGRKYLLPLAWIYRFVRALYRGTALGTLRSLLFKNTFASRKKVRERTEELKRWGL